MQWEKRQVADSDKKHVSGTTRSVYLYILTSRKAIGVRDVWRDLELSSPSLAQYHINKLLERQLIEIDRYGKYQATEEEKIGALRNFILLKGKLIPRLVIYGVLLSSFLALYLLLWTNRWDFRDIIVLTTSLFSIIALFFEAYNQYKGLR